MIKTKLETYSVLLVSILVSANISAQSFSIGNTSITFHDSSRNRKIETKIYYPSDNPGENVPIATGEFPVLVFGHGYLMGWQSYQNFWEELVPEGYLVCLPTTEMGAFPDHEDFGTDLKVVSSEMQIEIRAAYTIV